MTAAITTTALTAGVPASEGWRFVQETDPALVATWQAAREAFDRNEGGYQHRAAAWQRRAGATQPRPVSQYAEALAIAEAAVRAKFEQLLVAGDVVYGGFPSGQLGGDPVVIPIAALGTRRPRGTQITVRGTVFHDVRLFPAKALKGPGRPTGKTRAPRDADDRLRAWLAEVDHAAKTIPEITAELTAAHPEILSWWAESTAFKRVGALLPVRSNNFRP